MGWAINDEAKKEELKIMVPALRAQLYQMKRIASKIEHSEKGPDLVQGLERISKEIDSLQTTLLR